MHSFYYAIFYNTCVLTNTTKSRQIKTENSIWEKNNIS